MAIDLDNDGHIDDGSELFGTAFKLADGTNAANGFEALSTLDGNSDGVINADDAGFTQLKVWVDQNQNGLSDEGELLDLGSLDISSINLGANMTSSLNNGNWVGLESTFVTNSGNTYAVEDVWFRTAAGIEAEVPPSLDLTTPTVEANPVEDTALQSLPADQSNWF